MTYDVQSGAIKYIFYDPGSVNGAKKGNVINLNGSFLTGKTAFRPFYDFRITTIRRTNLKNK